MVRAVIPLHADVATASTRKCIATMVAVSVGLTVPVVRPVARAARNVRTSAISAGAPRVAPGVASRAVLGLNRRPVRGARVIVGERKSSEPEGPLDTVQIEECLQVRVYPASRIPDRNPPTRRSYPTNIPRRSMFFPLTRRVRSRSSARSSASAHAHPSAFACSSATSLNPAFLHPTPHARSAG